MVCRVPEAHRRAWAQCVVDLVRKDHSAVLDDLIERLVGPRHTRTGEGPGSFEGVKSGTPEPLGIVTTVFIVSHARFICSTKMCDIHTLRGFIMEVDNYWFVEMFMVIQGTVFHFHDLSPGSVYLFTSLGCDGLSLRLAWWSGHGSGSCLGDWIGSIMFGLSGWTTLHYLGIYSHDDDDDDDAGVHLCVCVCPPSCSCFVWGKPHVRGF